MAALSPTAEDLWTVSVPHVFLGLHIGTRMTVVRLSSGGLLLHSPVPVDDALFAAIEALGEVRHIVCPNLYHHTYAREAAQRFPNALMHGPEKLQKKRPDLGLDAFLSETPHADWGEDFTLISIEGSLLGETVFYHRATRTLIASDLVEYFPSAEHTLTRAYLKAGGILGRPGWHPVLRLMYRDRARARAAVERILELPFERLILAHGDPITEDAREATRSALSWLGVTHDPV